MLLPSFWRVSAAQKYQGRSRIIFPAMKSIAYTIIFLKDSFKNVFIWLRVSKQELVWRILDTSTNRAAEQEAKVIEVLHRSTFAEASKWNT